MAESTNITNGLGLQTENSSGSEHGSEQGGFARNQFDARMTRLWAAVGVQSDAQLAKVLGIKHQSVSSARQRRQLPYAWIAEISEQYGISADWLLFGEGPMRREDRSEWEKAEVRKLVQEELARSPIEEGALSGVIEAVETWLYKHGKVITAEKKAQLIVVLYNYVVSVGGSLDENTTNQYLRLVA